MVFGKIFSKIFNIIVIYGINSQFYFLVLSKWMFIIFFIIFSFPPYDFIIYIYEIYFYLFIINVIRKNFIEDDNASVGEKSTDIDNEEEVKQTSEYIKEFI